MALNFFIEAWQWWFKLVSLTTQEAEIRRIKI
jgi:hypothetical protein